MPAGDRLRPVLEWAAEPPKGLLRAWEYTPDAFAATWLFRAFLRTFGLLPAAVAEAVYLLLRLLLLPKAARTVLRRWDLVAYEERMERDRGQPPTGQASVRPRG